MGASLDAQSSAAADALKRYQDYIAQPGFNPTLADMLKKNASMLGAVVAFGTTPAGSAAQAKLDAYNASPLAGIFGGGATNMRNVGDVTAVVGTIANVVGSVVGVKGLGDLVNGVAGGLGAPTGIQNAPIAQQPQQQQPAPAPAAHGFFAWLRRLFGGK